MCKECDIVNGQNFFTEKEEPVVYERVTLNEEVPNIISPAEEPLPELQSPTDNEGQQELL